MITEIGAGEYLGTYEPGSPEWDALRAAGIGASEIGAILGFSTWESEFSLWQRKAGRIGPAPENDEMTWGRYLEAPIADRFADQHPELSIARTGTWRSLERPWQLCNPDRLADGVIPIECKFAPYGDGFGPSGTDEIPLNYRCQLLQQCDVLGAPYGWLVALVGASYREYLIDADPLDFGVLRSRGSAFWSSLPTDDDPVGRPPDIDGSDHTFRALKELHPSVGGGDIEVPFSLALKVEHTQAAAAAATEALQQTKNEVLDVMGTAKRARCANVTVATRVAYPKFVQLRLAKPAKPTGTITENL